MISSQGWMFKLFVQLKKTTQTCLYKGRGVQESGMSLP